MCSTVLGGEAGEGPGGELVAQPTRTRATTWTRTRATAVRTSLRILRLRPGRYYDAAMTLSAPRKNPRWSNLRCFKCERAHDVDKLQTVCTDCGLPLRVDYDYAAITL